MATSIATVGVQNLAALAETMPGGVHSPTNQGTHSYLTFNGKTGEWLLGRDKDHVLGEVVIVAPSWTDGWVCWKGGVMVERHQWSWGSDDDIPGDELEDHGPYNVPGDGWKREIGVTVAFAEDGTAATYQTSSKSGLLRIQDLMAAARPYYVAGQGYLLCRLGADAFQSHGQKNYAPRWEVLGGIDHQMMLELASQRITVEQALAGKRPKGRPRTKLDEDE